MAYYSNSSSGTELPRDLRDALGKELWRDERLLWTGQPGKSLTNNASSWGAFVFGIPWTAFAVFWTVMAFTMTQSTGTPLAMKIFFPLFGLPFVAVGVGMLASPFLSGNKQNKFIYAVTDKRVILMHLAKNMQIRSYTPRNPNYYQSVTRADGSGDLTFAPTFQHGTNVALGNMAASQIAMPVFYGIPNVRQVESLLRETFVDGSHVAEEKATTGVGKAPGYYTSYNPQDR